ncbi:probable folate-biopterin transporter 6 [Juglans microcarpa x Juglans regia]|uniref:probable folate-biopterin transporter 6 n=1 Tax=Juglans microcarpa x Juglans regia TaxID=2249226 RepID=UPI001B7F0490|nr:probable folate-biopterin transporter 6 [Juglans microcarpa x Juglans regia]
MDVNLETEKLVKKPVHPSQLSPNQTLNHNVRHSLLSCSISTTTVLSILLQPFQWLQMLSSQLNPSFVLGIFLVHGLSQGFSGSYFKVVSDYYWKDVQKVQPSVVQLFVGLYYIPWIIKPAWGLLTDLFPVGGYQRRPYFILAGALGTVSATVVALGGSMAVVVALGNLIGVTAAVAIASVTIDACIARNSIEIRSLAPDLQTLCGFCSSVGSLVGYSTSGFFVHHLGAQEALGLLAVPQALLIVLGFLFYETKSTIHSEKKAVHGKVGVAMRGMQETIGRPQVWKPTLYIYLSLALSISTHEGQFYWYTDPKAGPAFSQEFVGIVHALGALASVAGVLIYHKVLKDYPFRKLLFLAQLLYAASGMLDLIFMLRWNLILGIPDYLFVVMEECVSSTVGKIRWMPMVVLSTQLCPIGIEGTFFALLMCIDSLGSLSSKWGGGIVLHIFHVTRTDFTYLWSVVLIRNMLRIGTLALVFLVPNAVQSDNLLPLDVLTKNSTQSIDDES